MSSNTPSFPARRDRRLAARRTRQHRRRPALLVAGLAVGLVATAGLTATAMPTSPAQASAAAPTANFALASYTSPLASTKPSASTTTVSSAAQKALADAGAAVTGASAVTSDIQASGLDIGTPDITVDTTALQIAVSRLQGADRLPEPLVPDLTAKVSAATTAVAVRTAGLRGSLDAAVAVKAQQEAAAKAAADAAAAQAAADAAAAQKAAASSSSSSSSSSGTSASYASAGTSAGEAQAIAHDMVAARGWGDDQFSCLVSLWNRESGWNVHAANSSGAYGIPQALPGSKMSSAGPDWQNNASTQIAWGLGYISGRYGTPSGAWDHSNSSGWY